LQATGAKVRLVPGQAGSAPAQQANSLGQHDLVLISADQTEAALKQGWFYFPRILAEGGVVFRQEAAAEGEAHVWRRLTQQELQALTQPPPRKRAA
jgi:hypothetical protein